MRPLLVVTLVIVSVLVTAVLLSNMWTGEFLTVVGRQTSLQDHTRFDKSSVAANKIGNLPGAPPVNFDQYTGYFTVGTNLKMFYWFVESQNNPATDPVLLWLTGGPGCSGLLALLTEWGPLQVNPDGTTLRVNEWGWNRNTSVLTIESPVGVGFSYGSGVTNIDDNRTAVENWNALKEFFTAFPQYVNNDFYVTGESYGGIYVPTLVSTILDRQSQFKINIKGFAIGNGCVSRLEDDDSIIEWEYNHGMIDDTKWQTIRQQCCVDAANDCNFHQYEGTSGICGSFVDNQEEAAWELGMDPYDAYADCQNSAIFGTVGKSKLHQAERMRKRIKRKATIANNKRRSLVSYGTPTCLNENPVINYLNQPAVRTAIGASPSAPSWDICSDQVKGFYTLGTSTTAPYFTKAINAGLRALLYYGDSDMVCDFLGGQRFAYHLGFKAKNAKQAYHVAGQVGGFCERYQGLDFCTVKGAGHMVPTDKPQVSWYLLNAFLTQSNY